MNNVDLIKSDLIEEIKKLEFVKRLHELEHIIDDNPLIMQKFGELTECQKQIVNAGYYNKVNAKKEYEEKLKKIKDEISDIPFVDEYLDLLDEGYDLIKMISEIMEKEINKDL